MRAWIFSIAACALWSCGAKGGDAPPSEPARAPASAVRADASDRAARKQEPPATPAPALPVQEAPLAPPPGWSALTLEDAVPVCVFSSYEERGKAAFLPQVKKQTLRAGEPIVVGAFAPWCMNEACDQRATLQCWIEQAQQTLVVHTRMTMDHKPGARCKEGCEIVAADCESPALAPGTYTLRHGAEARVIKIPSTLGAPCIQPKAPPKP